jgi:hypothetical protein
MVWTRSVSHTPQLASRSLSATKTTGSAAAWLLIGVMVVGPLSAAEFYVELLDREAEAGFKCFEPVRFAVFIPDYSPTG